MRSPSCRLTVGPEFMAVPRPTVDNADEVQSTFKRARGRASLRTVAGSTAPLSSALTPGNIMHSTADPSSSPSGWKSLFFRPAPRQSYASKRQLYETCRNCSAGGVVLEDRLRPSPANGALVNLLATRARVNQTLKLGTRAVEARR